jgi:hypothetical protein
MSHLRESEFVDLLDGVLPATRVGHVEECSECAEKLDALRGTLGRVSDVDVPEPSPLFWEHFSARVRDGVQDVTPGNVAPWSGWLHHAGVKWAVAAALVVLVAVAGARIARIDVTRHPDTAIAERATASRASDPSPAATIDPFDALDGTAADDDVAWGVVRAVADEVPWDEQVTASLQARPGTVERAVLSLKGEARAELIRLLEAETKRPGA